MIKVDFEPGKLAIYTIELGSFLAKIEIFLDENLNIITRGFNQLNIPELIIIPSLVDINPKDIIKDIILSFHKSLELGIEFSFQKEFQINFENYKWEEIDENTVRLKKDLKVSMISEFVKTVNW